LGYLLFAASAAGFSDLEIPFPVFNPFSTQNVTAYTGLRDQAPPCWVIVHVVDNSEAQLGPKLVQSLNKFALVAVGVKNAGLPVGVGGQVVEVV
jgi:hypothetical protein